jgi:hypothetical protein
MCKFGRLSHFLETKKRAEIIAFLRNAKQINQNPVFKVFQTPSQLTAASFEFAGNETITKYLTMTRKGRLILLASVENRWDPEEDPLEYKIHMSTDIETLSIHLAKIDENDIDFPLTILKKEADLFLYTLG